jgi:predicted AAA+ superfamily ATPase
MKKDYLPRVIDNELDLALGSSGAVLIEGAKWCGKTRTAEEHSSSALYIHDVDNRKYYLHMLESKPSSLLEGETPRLIDEWQDAPILWDGVRFVVDQRGKTGQFILTGSAVPNDKNRPLHSGAGRIARIFMRPMSLFESRESNGSVSLADLFKGDDVEGVSTLTIDGLAFALCRGGWPASVGEKESTALRYPHNYVKTIIDSDISRADGVKKDPVRVSKLLHSLARNISTEAKLTTLQKDISGADADNNVSITTITLYMNALERIFVIENLPAWGPTMRSRSVLRNSPKRHFTDPSVAVNILGASPERLIKDFETFGLLFESLCIRDLRVYAQALDGKVFHYRDGDDLEVDAIVHLRDGRWGAAEIKMGADEIEKGAKNLMKLKEKVDTDKMGKPSFMMILTATDRAYRRNDGIYIVPVGCLKD